ncbi:MAG TPA: cation diffusion facilitator family transporter [Lachnospiraceae bacterium]|nr:cation diffusion facilitator family transporter [Lachnospiraceae bacterium]
MTEFLIKKFIKNPDKTKDPDVRLHYGILASIVGILCNVSLFLVKFISGAVMGSLSVIADSFNNLSDAASNIISFIGVKMASRPADKEHPFGHGRIEYISALIVAFIIIEVGFELFKESIGKIKAPTATAFELVPFLILILSIGVKLWMAVFNRTVGSKINSSVLTAAAADSKNDVIVTSVTIIVILLEYIFPALRIDGWAGVAVSIFVMYSGFGIARDTIEPLIGGAEDPELCTQISELVESYDGIIGTHDLVVHNYGPNRSMASIHAEVPSDCNIEDAHEVIDRAEREVSGKLGITLVIHMDPVEIHNEHVQKVRSQVADVLKSVDDRITFHDFRMVNGKNQINLIFDIVVPFDYDKEKQGELLKKIRSGISQLDRRYQCVITCDKDYIRQA